MPFAGVSLSWDSYTEMVQKALPEYKIIPIHKAGNMIEAVNKAEAIMVGGGNTFHLLAKVCCSTHIQANILNNIYHIQLYEHRLLECIRERVLGSKAFYIGWSAGSNVAGPDVGTSNDMPIVWPPSDKALNLVPYNLNPHYSEWKPPNYKGEGRIDRLNEAALMKKRPIVAFSEGVAIKVDSEIERELRVYVIPFVGNRGKAPSHCTTAAGRVPRQAGR